MHTSPSLQGRIQAAWAARGALACSLWPLAQLFGAVVALRRACHGAGLLRTERLPVPVIVVGNLVAGGAGKTPTVLAVVELLRRRGFSPGVVSRGYGRAGDAVLEVEPDMPAQRCGDEPLLLRLRARVPVFVGRDRAAAARALLDRHRGVDVLVSDDGLQHLRLARDAQLIVFDERGAGNGWLLPAGPLREPMAAAVPPRSVVLYNAPAPTTRWPGALLHSGLAGVRSLADWWAGAAPEHALLQALAARPLLAVAGVARPGRFFALLRAQGLRIDELALPDHHPYATLPWPERTADVVVTEKDAVKLPPGTALGATRVWVATLDLRLPPEAESALLRLLPSPPAAPCQEE